MPLSNTSTNKATPRLLLYKRDASPPSCAVRMLGEILGLQFDFKEPDLVKLEHRKPEFKKINPMSTIPVLQDGDLIVSESHAILLYLVNKYGGEHRASLYPVDPEIRAIVDQCLFFDTGVMFIRLKEIALPTFLGLRGSPTEEEKENIENGFAVVEAYLENRNYVACDHLTIADLSVGSTVTAIQVMHKLNAEKFPKCKAWLDRLQAEPYFQKINSPGAALFAKFCNHFWNTYENEK